MTIAFATKGVGSSLPRLRAQRKSTKPNFELAGFVLSPMTGESRGTLVKYICKCDTGSSVASGLSAFTAFVPGLSTETPAGFFTSPMTSLKAICEKIMRGLRNAEKFNCFNFQDVLLTSRLS